MFQYRTNRSDAYPCGRASYVWVNYLKSNKKTNENDVFEQV